jgi:hypothetical protein
MSQSHVLQKPQLMFTLRSAKENNMKTHVVLGWREKDWHYWTGEGWSKFARDAEKFTQETGVALVRFGRFHDVHGILTVEEKFTAALTRV